ncbi:MAG TPA: hypothetical protein VHC40_08760 [Rhizomicrobium sp.]|jgi:hypothetical protein|nr:hypothetical protein [Rhizomicrobium sp.]
MDTKTPEQLLNDQLAACLEAMQDCLAHSRTRYSDDTYGHRRRNDIAFVAKLMKASARLTESLASLRGETRHSIRVSRESVDKAPVDKGGGA